MKGDFRMAKGKYKADDPIAEPAAIDSPAVAVLDNPPVDPLAEHEERWRDFVERVCILWAKGVEPTALVRDALYARLGPAGVKAERELGQGRLAHARRIGTTARRAERAKKIVEADRAVAEENPKLQARIIELQNAINANLQTQAALVREKDLSDQAYARLRGFRRDSGCISPADEAVYNGRLACLRSAGCWKELVEGRERLRTLTEILRWNLVDHRPHIVEYVHHLANQPGSSGERSGYAWYGSAVQRGSVEAETWWHQHRAELVKERDALAPRIQELAAAHDRDMAEVEKIRDRFVDRVDEILSGDGPQQLESNG
jgi:hypothetical protein